VRRHAYVDPLAYPGEADLTAHVDFAALAAAARRPGVAVLGPITQGTFLTALGIRERAEQLSSRNPAAASGIRAALERLTGETGMGSLFKVMAVGPQGLGLPPFVPETAAAV
jgi:SAM-dependent MidA family methyltransferase